MNQVELPIPIKVTNPIPVDFYYGPYPDIPTALATVPIAIRHLGKKVFINGVGEHIWLDGLANADLISVNRYFELRNDSVKVTNTLTGNINLGVATFSDFTTTDLLGSTLNQFTFSTNGITPSFTGQVEISFNIELLGGGVARQIVGFRWEHDGSNGPWVRNTYMRSTGGSIESSANFSTTINVVAGVPIQIEHDNFSGAGTVISIAGGVEFVVKRVG